MNWNLLLLLSVVAVCLADEHVLNYSADEYDENVPKKHHFVMFFAPWCGHCKRLKPTWDQLAEKYNKETGPHDVTIAKVDCTVETATCAKEDVTGYPTLKFFKLGDDSVKYRGSRDLDALSRFVEEQMGAEKKTEEKSEDSKDADPVMPVPTNGLVELTDKTFNKFTEHGQHFIKFYAPWCGHCQRLAPVWEGIAKAFEYDKNVNIGKLDCTAHRGPCSDMEVKGYPTLLWIRDGKKIEKYQGSRNHDDLKAFIDRMMKTEDEHKYSEKEKVPDTPKAQPTAVKVLTKDTFKDQLSTGLTFVKFFAPWCGHCKRLAPTWEQLANKFEGNSEVTIAKVDCTTADERSICDEQKVDGFPTMLLFKDGKKIDSYEDERKLDMMYTFVMNHVTAAKDEL